MSMSAPYQSVTKILVIGAAAVLKLLDRSRGCFQQMILQPCGFSLTAHPDFHRIAPLSRATSNSLLSSPG